MAENDKQKRKRGRPRLYNESYAKRAQELLSQGCTHKETWNALKISKATFYQWQIDYPEFSDAIEKGQQISVPFLLGQLNKIATGYVERIPKKTVRKVYLMLPNGEKVQEKEIQEQWEEAYYKAPDPNTIRWMLANRAKDQWKLNPDNFNQSGERIPDVNISIGNQTLQGAQLATSEQEAKDLAPDLDQMHEDFIKDEEE